ncbi:MAG: AfsR/SARP family transcriptional regulator [Egibacteraceae bacterium]
MVDRLVEVVWGNALPVSTPGALQTLVSRLRRALGAWEGIELLTRSPGYLLRVTRDQVDALRFTDLVVEARDQPPARSAALLDEAYAEFARPGATRLEELRLAAWEDRFDAVLALDATTR